MRRFYARHKVLLLGVLCLIVVSLSISSVALAHHMFSSNQVAKRQESAVRGAFSRIAPSVTVAATRSARPTRTPRSTPAVPTPTTMVPTPTPIVTPTQVATTSPISAGTLIWSDEFQGSAGTPPDGSKWTPDVGNGGSNAGWGNLQLEYDTNNHNVYQDGQGNLVIEARKENPAGYQCWNGPCAYTSARITTSGKFATLTHGRVEARIKMASEQGIWPAFWMLGANNKVWPADGEVDIMENPGLDPTINYGSYHGPGINGGGTYKLPGGASYTSDYHIFAVDWDHDSVRYSVDGHVYETLYRANVSASQWVFDGPFFLILNVAVGGKWPGSPNASTVFPEKMWVDYVRVYA
jgi:beta-glucanase (GH16 family)